MGACLSQLCAIKTDRNDELVESNVVLWKGAASAFGVDFRGAEVTIGEVIETPPAFIGWKSFSSHRCSYINYFFLLFFY